MSKTLHLRRLLALFIILSAATLAIMVFRYFSKAAYKENHRPSLQSSVDLALKTIHFTESSGGGIKWELFAAKGEYDKSAELSTLQDIRFVIKQVERYGNLVVTAREGQFAHASKKVTLAGDVLAKNDKGASFETSRITFDSGKQLFKTVEKVRMMDGGLTVEGKGMEMSMENKEARIMSQVTATILPGKLQK
jgi:LPS export ABC transporter protein LptC